jgi:hypothetical protein
LRRHALNAFTVDVAQDDMEPFCLLRSAHCNGGADTASGACDDQN